MEIIQYKQDDKDLNTSKKLIDGYGEMNDVFHCTLNGKEKVIFVGSLSAAQNIPLLQYHGVKYVLTAARGLSVEYETENAINHFSVAVVDHPNENILNFIPPCIEFIDKALSNSDAVLVHCASGISRSVSVVVAWMLHKNQVKTVKECLEIIASKRPYVNPNIGFRVQLQALEECDGNIEKANEKFKETLLAASNGASTANFTLVLVNQRHKASDIHFRVDDIEVRVKDSEFKKQSESDNGKDAKKIKNELTEIIKEIDELMSKSATSTMTLINDKGTIMMLKSAKSKATRLIEQDLNQYS